VVKLPFVLSTILHLEPISTDNLVTLVIGVFGFGATLIGLRFAYGQLVESKEVAEQTQRVSKGQFLLQLDEAFRQFNDVHRSLMQPNEPDPEWHPPDDNWTRVVLYMGLFERCKILIDYGLLDPEIFERQYGYRLRRIVATPTIVEQCLNPSRIAGWADFLALRDEVVELYEARKNRQTE
jgi:hypothetical protein